MGGDREPLPLIWLKRALIRRRARISRVFTADSMRSRSGGAASARSAKVSPRIGVGDAAASHGW